MSVVASVDFKQFVEDCIQSGYFRQFGIANLDPYSANFKNVTLKLEDVQWNKMTFEVPDFKHTKQVTMDSRNRDVKTKVTATAGAVPSSNINIVSGFMTGVPKEKATTSITMPKVKHLEGKELTLILTQSQQTVSLSQGRTSDHEVIKGAGSVTVESKPTVYQGAFKATARFTGPVTFRTQDHERTMQFNIETMAKNAHSSGSLRPPFSYYPNSLCWAVSGNMDLLVENVNVTRR